MYEMYRWKPVYTMSGEWGEWKKTVAESCVILSWWKNSAKLATAKEMEMYQ